MTRFYSLDEANARLAELRPLLEGLREDRDKVAEHQAALLVLRRTNGSEDHAAEVGAREAALKELVERMARMVRTIDDQDVALRDIQTGLVDFPAMANGRPIWLCWRLGEPEIDWWHERDAGFASRRPLLELT